MLSEKELQLVSYRSKLWVGPPAWGFYKGYKLNLKDAIEHLDFA